MFISIIKLIHLLFALGLLGLSFFCVVLISTKKTKIISQSRINTFTSINKIMLGVALFAALTGTLLVYPKDYTFHTHWIVAAYLLVVLFCILVSVRSEERRVGKECGFYWCS